MKTLKLFALLMSLSIGLFAQTETQQKTQGTSTKDKTMQGTQDKTIQKGTSTRDKTMQEGKTTTNKQKMMKTEQAGKTMKEQGNTWFVMATHNPDQCMKTMEEVKAKGGEPFLSKFYFGCMSGDHTAYAFLQGNTEEDVRQMLPKDLQANAQIKKVEKMTPSKMEKMHKQNMGDKK